MDFGTLDWDEVLKEATPMPPGPETE